MRKMKKLIMDQAIHGINALRMLGTFLDKNGLSRVEGRRIKYCNLAFTQKHYIIYPNNNHVTNLLITRHHNFTRRYTDNFKHSVKKQYCPFYRKKLN
jgi:hypothetical protein